MDRKKLIEAIITEHQAMGVDQQVVLLGQILMRINDLDLWAIAQEAGLNPEEVAR
jgi:hypothetical protein